MRRAATRSRAATPTSGELRRCRWAVLAAGMLALAGFSAVAVGLAVLAPQLREEARALARRSRRGALRRLGRCLPDAAPVGDRGRSLRRAPRAHGRVARLWGVARRGRIRLEPRAPGGAARGRRGDGRRANAASGRAVMVWFAPEERGLALGIRQTAVPAGGVLAAVSLPLLVADAGSAASFRFLAALAAAGATAGWIVLRDRPGRVPLEARFDAEDDLVLRHARLHRASSASCTSTREARSRPRWRTKRQPRRRDPAQAAGSPAGAVEVSR